MKTPWRLPFGQLDFRSSGTDRLSKCAFLHTLRPDMVASPKMRSEGLARRLP